MNLKITLDQMKNLSIDEIIRLYKNGYKIDSDIKSLENKSLVQVIDPIVDPFVNFGKATVSQGYSNLATTIILTSGNGTIFPDPAIDGAFNLVWWNSTDYGDPTDDPNKEIVRCTSRSGDILTITRAQEGTTASIKNLSGKTYKMVLSVTAKVFTDLQNVPAKSLQSATTAVSISGAIAPSIGQVLMATSPTAAAWQSLQPPTCFFVNILGSPSSGVFPLTVSFNSTIIGGTFPYTYLWTFGDAGTSTSPAPTHNYTANGVFTVMLTVTDFLGSTATSATTITVLTGVGLVANGLGMSESIVVPDFLAGFYNASANGTSPFLESVVFTDILQGINNTSAYGTSPLLDSIPTTDILQGIYNASADTGSPLLEDITSDESLAFLSSITIPSTASMARNSSITLTPICYLYATLISCPILSWSSTNTSVANVGPNGVVTSGNSTGTTNITARSGTAPSAVTSNICAVTVT